MIAPDVNVLICALRHEMPQHADFRSWLDTARHGPSPLVLFEPVLVSVVRITTHARAFSRPSALETVQEFFESLLASPNTKRLRAGERHWEIFLDLCHRANCRGPLVQDAYLAALALEHGCEWITADRDFARFPGLRWRHPLDPE